MRFAAVFILRSFADVMVILEVRPDNVEADYQNDHITQY